MSRNIPLRQRIRKALLLVSFLFFPITMNYLSPYVIMDGASQGIINGSLVMFGLMFLSALVIGRLWCGWVCPAGGFCEMAFPVNNAPVTNKKLDWVKWVIWVIWLGIILSLVISAGGYHSLNLFLDTQNGISVAGTAERPIIIPYIIYYIVLGTFFLTSVIAGRRGGCHTFCWMAPFMIAGRKIRNLLNLPALHLQAAPENCTNCKKCTTNCPMSLDVNAMVHQINMENSECILCGNCVDNCAAHAIRYSFGRSRSQAAGSVHEQPVAGD